MKVTNNSCNNKLFVQHSFFCVGNKDFVKPALYNKKYVKLTKHTFVINNSLLGSLSIVNFEAELSFQQLEIS